MIEPGVKSSHVAGEVAFTQDEVVELGAEVVGGVVDGGERARRRSKPHLRVPSDEVRRQGQGGVGTATTRPNRPLSLTDLLVEAAFDKLARGSRAAREPALATTQPEVPRVAVRPLSKTMPLGPRGTAAAPDGGPAGTGVNGAPNAVEGVDAPLPTNGAPHAVSAVRSPVPTNGASASAGASHAPDAHEDDGIEPATDDPVSDRTVVTRAPAPPAGPGPAAGARPFGGDASAEPASATGQAPFGGAARAGADEITAPRRSVPPAERMAALGPSRASGDEAWLGSTEPSAGAALARGGAVRQARGADGAMVAARAGAAAEGAGATVSAADGGDSLRNGSPALAPGATPIVTARPDARPLEAATAGVVLDAEADRATRSTLPSVTRAADGAPAEGEPPAQHGGGAGPDARAPAWADGDLRARDSRRAGAAVPGATVAGATAVGSTVPGATVPGATVPGAAAAGATAAGAAVAGATVAGATVAGATVAADDPAAARDRSAGDGATRARDERVGGGVARNGGADAAHAGGRANGAAQAATVPGAATGVAERGAAARPTTAPAASAGAGDGIASAPTTGEVSGADRQTVAAPSGEGAAAGAVAAASSAGADGRPRSVDDEPTAPLFGPAASTPTVSPPPVPMDAPPRAPGLPGTQGQAVVSAAAIASPPPLPSFNGSASPAAPSPSAPLAVAPTAPSAGSDDAEEGAVLSSSAPPDRDGPRVTVTTSTSGAVVPRRPAEASAGAGPPARDEGEELRFDDIEELRTDPRRRAAERDRNRKATGTSPPPPPASMGVTASSTPATPAWAAALATTPPGGTPLPRPPSPSPEAGARTTTPPPAPVAATAGPAAATTTVAAGNPAAAPADATARKRRPKAWFDDVFDDDHLRTLPQLTPRHAERDVDFLVSALAPAPGAALLDVGCGAGRHVVELARRGYQVTGLDLSLPLLHRAAEAARAADVSLELVHGDMRDLAYDAEFDAAYCYFTTFGYFDDDTNRKVAGLVARALRPGGRFVLDVLNRDYVVRDLPARIWWQGDGCMVLEEVDFNYFTSRLRVQRSVVHEDGRQVEQEISIRAYSLHEVGKILHRAGFRVIEVGGGPALRGRFFGADSRRIVVVAERKKEP